MDQLAERSGVPPESISRVERGKTLPRLDTLDKIASGLGLGLADVVGDREVDAAGIVGIPAEVRGIALMLSGADPAVVEKARGIIRILVDD